MIYFGIIISITDKKYTKYKKMQKTESIFRYFHLIEQMQ